MGNAEIFEDIYAKNKWGGGSGSGSDPKYCEKYIKYIEDLLATGNYESVLDLGCGDWRVGAAIDWQGIEYLGVDAVECNVTHTPPSPNISFRQVDISDPQAIGNLFRERKWDLLILKDVLQHWTNKEITDLFSIVGVSHNWKTLITVNDHRYNRDPSKNNALPDNRDPRSNRYSWAPLPYNNSAMKILKLEPVLYYPRGRYKEVCRRDR